MVRSQDKLTFVESEVGYSDQKRSACQRDCKRVNEFIPADCLYPSIHYSLSYAPHYSLKRSVLPRTLTQCTSVSTSIGEFL